VKAGNDTLPFLYDSGNNFTSLSARFFNKYKNDIEGKCTKRKVITGGAGGMRKTEAYILDSLSLSVGNSNYTLDSFLFPPRPIELIRAGESNHVTASPRRFDQD